MKRIANFFQTVYQACVHFPFYGSIPQELYGASMRYFLALVTLLSVITTVVIGSSLTGAIDTTVNEFAASAPDFQFTIENGALSTNLPEPYVVLIDKTGAFDIREHAAAIATSATPIIIDTTGAFTSLDAYSEGVLITKTGAVVKQNYQTRAIDFADIDHASFSKLDALSVANQYKGTVKIIGIALLLIGAWIFLFVFHLLYVLFFSIFGYIFGKDHLRYGQVQQVGLYALTAPLIITTIYGFFAASIPYLFTGIFLVYFVMGLRQALHDTPVIKKP